MKYYNFSNSQIDAAINEWIHNKRNREILHDRYIDGLTFEKIAEKHGLSTQHIKSIVYHGQSVIFSHLDPR